VAADGRHTSEPENIAVTLGEVVDRTTVIVREEIELAKVEVTQKATVLARGAAVGIVAGIFVGVGALFFLHGLAWLIYYLLPVNEFAYFWGFFIVTLILFILAGVGGLLAYRWVRSSAPPTPDMAIEEAQRVKATVTGEPLPPRKEPKNPS
jgi:Putative Actinobacterial Holin-X, holin superfamily III